jgi:hypothetical protein
LRPSAKTLWLDTLWLDTLWLDTLWLEMLWLEMLWLESLSLESAAGNLEIRRQEPAHTVAQALWQRARVECPSVHGA